MKYWAGKGARSEQGHRHPHPRVAALSSQWSQSEGSPQSGCRPPLGAHRRAGQVGGTPPGEHSRGNPAVTLDPPQSLLPQTAREEAPTQGPPPPVPAASC